ncbi:MAG: ATP-dependent helicase [Deltaproteobacteria bacterium]|nr:ATP-dependent helicase [Deltaproteobacteria bacterium]
MPAHLSGLNPAQRAAAVHGTAENTDSAGGGPLLIIAGAGSGKTNTLAHRVAHLVLSGADPGRILLLTFTRRAAVEMTRRTQRIVASARARSDVPVPQGEVRWSGTFHAIANRLLRYHADSIGLDPAFTVLDRADSADLLDLQRDALGMARKASRFPRKATCLAIYSHAVNAQRSVEETLAKAFPWCESWADELKVLFRAYVDAKQRQSVLDYDDLLLYWHYLMAEADLARQVGERFDHVLVDEYQDTNALQASILLALRPDGRGLSVVGDDAQSIYAFRAASVRNILDFPSHFDPPARVVTLEQNYRSTQTILDACNAVIEGASERYSKRLFSRRSSQQRPILATVEDENEQVTYVVERILEHREAGVALKRQAVLIRTGHHSDLLEVELGRRNIPFVKFGGLKFLEAAHVKDMLGLLRWAENPRDEVAAFRVLQLLPGVGPGFARRALDHLASHRHDLRALVRHRMPAAAADDWASLCALMLRLADVATGWHGQVGLVRHWYGPHLERLYDAAHVRAGDLEQLEQIAASYPTRERFLTELTLDPPDASGDHAGDPLLDEDYLILSTIHSAKGQEWDVVYLLNAADGCMPSDMSTGSPEQIEEERRLLYVAMTRARDHLHVIHPLRFWKRQQHRHGDAHVLAPLCRFLGDDVIPLFERRACARPFGDGDAARAPGRMATRIDVGTRLREMWR